MRSTRAALLAVPLLALGTGVALAERPHRSAVVAVTSSSGPSLSATEPAAPFVLPDPTTDPLTAAEARRRELGLRSDPSFVKDLLRRTSTDPTYGTPLLPQEKADVAGRAAHADDVAVVEHYAAAYPASYGGLVALDDGHLLVAFTDGADGHAADLARLLPAADTGLLEFRQVDFSLAHLRDVEAALLQRLADATLASNPVSGVEVDVPTNRVVVSMTTQDDSVEALLADPAVSFDIA